MAELLGVASITEYLISRDPSLVPMEEPTNPEYKCFNTGGVETVVGEFLYGLVRMVRPDNVFETGTHHGVSSSYIGQALHDNQKGMLTTLEIDKSCISISEKRWDTLRIHQYICIDKAHSLEYELVDQYDLMFLDSEPYFRFKELRRFYPYLKPGGYAFIHDTPRSLCQGNVNPDHPEFRDWPFGPINREVKDLVKDHDLVPFHFGTPRGMTGFYKKHPDDYRWERV